MGRTSKQNCCVVGCSYSYATTGKEVKFFTFPNKPWEKDRKRKWIQAVNRINPDGSNWEPSKNARICSRHFLGNEKSQHPDNPSYMPTIFPDVYKKRESGVAMQEESREIVGPVMIVEDPGEPFIKEEVLKEEDTDVGDTSAWVENINNCNEIIETREISIVKHEPCWSDWEVQDVGITKKKLLHNGGKVQSDLPVAEGAEIYSDILKQEFVNPEFVCMDSDAMEAWDETNEMCVDPLADPDDGKRHYTISKHEFQECLGDLPSISTRGTQFVSRNSVKSPAADNCVQTKPFHFLILNLNITRGQSCGTVAGHLPGPHPPHQCQTCSRTFTTGRLLLMHVKTHWNRCEKCGQKFQTQSILLAHIKHGCSGLVQIKCESCGKTFSHRSHFTSHIKHDCGRQEPYKCESCGKTFNQRSGLVYHIKYVCGCQEPHKCKSCGKSFPHRTHLLSHIKHDCGRQEPHRCESCGKTFTRRRCLMSHMKHVCHKQEPLKCDSCDKTYSHRSRLLSHKKHDCGRQEPHKCESCGKTFNHRYRLVLHKNHDCGRPEPHKCESCGKTFKIGRSLEAHRKYSCGPREPHKCNSCGRSYKHKSSLMIHIKYDCGLQEPHRCESCGQMFSTRSHLVSHKKHDCGRREPHKCDTCGKTFNRKYYLTSHKKHDCGHPEPIVCKSCGKTFQHASTLTRHVKLYCNLSRKLTNEALAQ